ncbi:hypothetical protein BC831DRAFT_547895 [Entophlyctis helioformis]|nr:hypothetical protein BC831DRAFT_547895 [Entophlyctis helioformis]
MTPANYGGSSARSAGRGSSLAQPTAATRRINGVCGNADVDDIDDDNNHDDDDSSSSSNSDPDDDPDDGADDGPDALELSMTFTGTHSAKGQPAGGPPSDSGSDTGSEHSGDEADETIAALPAGPHPHAVLPSAPTADPSTELVACASRGIDGADAIAIDEAPAADADAAADATLPLRPTPPRRPSHRSLRPPLPTASACLAKCTAAAATATLRARCRPRSTGSSRRPSSSCSRSVSSYSSYSKCTSSKSNSNRITLSTSRDKDMTIFRIDRRASRPTARQTRTDTATAHCTRTRASRPASCPTSNSSQQQQKKTRRKKRKKPRFLLASTNIFSQFFFVWVFALVRICRRVSDIRNINFALKETETARVTGDELEAVWKEEVYQFNEKASLMRALFKAFGRIYIPLALWRIFWGAFTWFGSFWLLQWLILFQESRETDDPQPLWRGHVFAVGLFVCSVMASLCFHQLTIQNTRIGIQCRAALMVLIYRKSLRLSYVRGGVGDIVNLISNECNRIAEASVNWHFFWSAGLECAVLLSLAFIDIGLAALPAFIFVLIILLPLQYGLARYSSRMSYRTTVLVTQRVHLMSEILTAIKLIKFYAWENYYRKKVTEMRKSLLTKIASFTIVFIAPVFSTAACIGTYYATTGKLKPSIVFTLLSLFNTLRYPLVLLPNAERTIAAANISLKKLEEFFLLPEVDLPDDEFTNPDPQVLLTIKDASFMWDGDLDHPHIVNLNLTLRRGTIKRTQGSVSNYGSTIGYIPQEPWLINATLRDNILFGLEPDEHAYADAIRFSGLTDDFLLLSNGDETFVNELNLSPSQKQRISIARCIYHNPEIVCMEDCLSDFDQNHAKRLFKECIRNQISKTRCVVMHTQQKQFLPDCDFILVLKGGKVVEQGTYQDLKSRNVNFSAWVSDYVHMDDDPTGLLDRMSEIRLDPQTSTNQAAKQISALRPPNPHSGPLAHLSIRSKLKTKPRSSPLALTQPITAEKDATETTHQSTLRQIIELNAGTMQTSQLNEQTISKLIERSQTGVLTGNTSRPPANFANQDIVSRTIEANQLTVHSVHDFDVAMTFEPGLLTEAAQERTFGLPYRQFLSERTGMTVGVVLIVGFFLAHMFRFASDIWLMILVEDRLGLSNVTYLSVYCSLCFIIAVAVLARGFVFCVLILRKSVSLHERLIEAVMRAPMAFYDITPLGHILSFFARHLFLIDEFLPETALQVLSFSPLVLGTILIVAVIVPWFWATLPVYIGLCVLAVRSCLSVQRKFHQLEASNKSPMFAHLSTTLEGLFSIRLYNVQARFDTFNRTLIDADHKALYSLLLVKTLMALGVDLVSSLFIYMTALFVVLFDTSPSVTGLAVSNALQLLLFVPWFVKMSLELHSSVSSVSSVIYFGEHVPREDRWRDQNRAAVRRSDGSASGSASRGDSDPGGKKGGAGKDAIDPQWPSRGEVEFRNITLRYHRYGVAVLKSVSFHIQPKEKIAIVGRSGSGKTTVLMSLLRIAEPADGQILIDGVDTAGLDLSDLRSRIAVIPQEPVMLTGTIRSNLDPFGSCGDDEIWRALKAVHLADKIREMPLQLETPIHENGKTFNLSERQLFCIARAIMIKTTIVVLDEPATSVDKETELLIQSVMKENFRDATVIVLATRFRVIVQMDRVMVMHHGRVVEFDTPLALMDDPKSKFSLMLAQTGDVDPEKLRGLAQAKADAKAKADEQAQQAAATTAAPTTPATALGAGPPPLAVRVVSQSGTSASTERPTVQTALVGVAAMSPAMSGSRGSPIMTPGGSSDVGGDGVELTRLASQSSATGASRGHTSGHGHPLPVLVEDSGRTVSGAPL